MDIEDLAFSLARAAFATAANATDHDPAVSRPGEYARCELALLSDAVSSVEEYPDRAYEIWSAIFSIVCELNDHLAALEAPLLNFVTYEAFKTWVKPQHGRAHAFDA